MVEESGTYLSKNIAKTLRIATVGYQEKYRDVLMKLFSVKAKDGIVRLNVGAVACAPMEKLPALRSLYNISFYETVEELCENMEGLDTVFDMSEDGRYIEFVRSRATGKTSVVGGDTLLLFQYTELDPDKLELKPCDLVRAMGFFSSIVEQSKDEYWYVDEEGIVFDANKAVLDRPRDMAFEGEGDVLINSKLKYASTHKNVISECFERVARADQIISEIDNDGRMRFFGITAYPVHTKDGKVQAVLLSRQDITDTYATMRNFQQDDKIAAIGELSSFLAHEIRNPLFAISGFAKAVMKNQDLPEGDKKKIQIIVNESKRLEDLLKVMLNFAQSGKDKKIEFSLNNLIRAVLKLLEGEFEAIGGAIKLNLTEPLPIVRGNEELFKQCVLNGVKNAIEAMPEGGILAIRTGLTADNWVLAQIADTGQGIPLDVMEHLFNPFFTTKPDKSGLGLAMIKKYMEGMGGKVRLRSKQGRGTVLSIYLPPAAYEGGGPKKTSARNVLKSQVSVMQYGGRS